MSGTDVREWAEEIDRFAVEAEHLDRLLTVELGKYWKGDAYNACLRESRDNREFALEVIKAYRDKMDEICCRCGETETLPSDFLL